MPTKHNRLSKIVLVPLFVFVIGTLVEVVPQSSPVESLCLRRCHLRAARSSSVKVSRLYCYHRCSNRSKQVRDQQALTANVFKQQRIRKALKPVPSCPDSSPDQTVDWTPSEVNVTFGKYPNTSHWYANVSWAPLNNSYGNWSGILVRLVVSPSYFPIPTICSVHSKNRTFLNINISSYQYRYREPIYLKVLALPYSPKGDFSDISRYEPPTYPPTTVQATVVPSSSAVNQTTAAIHPTTPHTTGVFPTTARKSSCLREEHGNFEWHPSRIDGCFFNRSNGDWFANISWTPLTNSTVNWTCYFLSLYFGDISKQLVYNTPKCFKVPKNQTSIILDSSHGWKYPQTISVSVTAYPFPRHLISVTMALFSPERGSSTNLTITASPSQFSVPATNASPRKSDIIITVFSSVSGGFIVILLAVLLVCRRRRKSSSMIPVTTPTLHFKYHAFIIYNMIDSSDWVDNTLIPTLENYYFKCCVHWKDFPPGEIFAETVVKSVYSSCKIIAVVSKNFVKSNNCGFEMDQAVNRLMNYGDDCLIVIKYDDVDVHSSPMMATLLNRSYIDFTKRTDKSTWESKLVDILKKVAVEEEESVRSDGNTNNNLSQGNSMENDSKELMYMCSCQSV